MATGAKRSKKNIPHGVFYINASFNNTMITCTDQVGNTIAWKSAGSMGFKGSRKSTPFAAQVAADECAKIAVDNGLRSAIALVRGPGGGREAALRALAAAGIKITLVKDITALPHNGCRPPKRRRV